MTRMLLIDVINNETKPVEIDSLHDIYKYLQCDSIDGTARIISGRRYGIYVDDEGFLHTPIPSVSACGLYETFVGNMLLFNLPDLDGVEKSLTDDDIAFLKARIIDYEGHPLLIGVGL